MKHTKLPAKQTDSHRSSLQNLYLIFGLEGILYQFSQSINGFGNALYATNLGATDTQIGLIQTVPNVLALLLMLPFGVLSDRLRQSRTVPLLCLLVMSVMYFFYGSVPLFGALRMSLYFVFLGMTVASAVLYNAQWQNFFGDVTSVDQRSETLTFRTRIMSAVGIVTPLICGFFLSAQTEVENKLLTLQIFYYLCGVLVLLQALVLHRLPCPEREPAAVHFHAVQVLDACQDAFRSKYFRRFCLTGVLFYIAWHPDWSVWYIEQTQYAHMSEAHLSISGALGSIIQILSLGFFSKVSRKKSAYYTMILAQLGYVVAVPLALFAMSPIFPDASKPWAFLVCGTLPGILQCTTNLNLVQMMLSALPPRNRSLIISLYTMLVTLSNAVLPLLGVRLYTALGADWHAVLGFNAIMFALRVLSLLEIIWLFRVTRREGRLFAGQAG